jgi:hypothetical protein
MIFAIDEYDARSSLQYNYVTSIQHIKHSFNGRGEVQPPHFQISNLNLIVLNDCKIGRANTMLVCRL